MSQPIPRDKPLIRLARNRPPPDSRPLAGYDLDDNDDDGDDDDGDSFFSTTHKSSSSGSVFQRKPFLAWLLICGVIGAVALVSLGVHTLRDRKKERQELESAWESYQLDRYTYGSNLNPHFGSDITQLQNLDESMLPGHTAPTSRLVVIGDVHGHRHARELCELPSLVKDKPPLLTLFVLFYSLSQWRIC